MNVATIPLQNPKQYLIPLQNYVKFSKKMIRSTENLKYLFTAAIGQFAPKIPKTVYLNLSEHFISVHTSQILIEPDREKNELFFSIHET